MSEADWVRDHALACDLLDLFDYDLETLALLVLVYGSGELSEPGRAAVVLRLLVDVRHDAAELWQTRDMPHVAPNLVLQLFDARRKRVLVRERTELLLHGRSTRPAVEHLNQSRLCGRALYAQWVRVHDHLQDLLSVLVDVRHLVCAEPVLLEELAHNIPRRV
jgi:hypothetical protein